MSRTQSSNPNLFAHLSWKTHALTPLLACNQTRQAAYEAVQTRTRTHLCRVLAIGGTNTHVHLIVRFPASLAISHVARFSMQASEEAISRVYVTLYPECMEIEEVWDRTFQAQTLGSNEADDAQAFLQKEILKSAEQAAKEEDEKKR